MILQQKIAICFSYLHDEKEERRERGGRTRARLNRFANWDYQTGQQFIVAFIGAKQANCAEISRYCKQLKAKIANPVMIKDGIDQITRFKNAIAKGTNFWFGLIEKSDADYLIRFIHPSGIPTQYQ